jgi:hypothetical protein
MLLAFGGGEHFAAFHAGSTSAQKTNVLDRVNPSKQEIRVDDI